MFSRKSLNLFIISLISLYFELVVIRWLSSEIRIFAYFKNLPLMACLFGLGLGMATSFSKRDLSEWFPSLLVPVVAVICFAEPLGLVHITFTDPFEYYLIGTSSESLQGVLSLYQKLAILIPAIFVLVAIFNVTALAFVCLGQKLGRSFSEHEPLRAYSINVFASLLGILLFSLLSFLGTKPWLWMTIGCGLCLFMYRGKMQIALLLACAALPFFADSGSVIWSPYYRVEVSKSELPAGPNGQKPVYGHTILTNHDGMEGAYDNSPGFIASLTDAQREVTLDYYEMLYELIGDKPRSILILAAGAGNDVAAALRHGATEVDAVEIDPSILALGKQIHPEHPYQDPRVRGIVDDARAYLKRAPRKYDLVNFAYLDSHSAFSSMSSIRLEGYVYTKESFKDAAELVNPGGVFAVTFYALKWWQVARIYKTVELVFGKEPVGAWSKNGKGLTFLVGPGLDSRTIQKQGFKLFCRSEAELALKAEGTDWQQIEPTSDDWPFFFMRARGISIPYISGLLFCLITGWLMIGRLLGKLSTDRIGLTMFFLGAAFLLIETKSISQIGLLMGTTWLVNSAVIAGVLCMILLANAVVIFRNLENVSILFVMLIVVLTASCFVPMDSLNSMGPTLSAILGIAFLCIPLLFAALIFAITFKQTKEPHLALGMNLFGCLVGGVLEYLSLWLGVSALNLIAAGLYACAGLIWLR